MVFDSKNRFANMPVLHFLFRDRRLAWLWLILRLYLGYVWLEAGLGKALSGDWILGGSAKPLIGFVNGALAKTSGAHPDVEGWYAWFLSHVVLPNASLFAHLVTIGEILVGLGLILGVLTSIAAFFGLMMNLNFLFSGTVSINPKLIVLSLLLLLAWRVSGYFGLDRYLGRRLNWWPAPAPQ